MTTCLGKSFSFATLCVACIFLFRFCGWDVGFDCISSCLTFCFSVMFGTAAVKFRFEAAQKGSVPNDLYLIPLVLTVRNL